MHRYETFNIISYTNCSTNIFSHTNCSCAFWSNRRGAEILDMEMKSLGLITCIMFFSCSSPEVKYEYIEKNDTYRNTIESGYFSLLSHGYTYYEFDNLNHDEIIVLVHGFSVPSYIWDETYYESIKRGFGVLRMDLFGRGYSDNPDVIYNDDLYANQVLELLDELKIDKKINLVGLSNGGRVISKIAENNSDRIRRLIYVAPAGFHNSKLKPDTTEITEDEIELFIRKRYKTISKGQLDDFKEPSKFKGWDTKYESLLKYKGFARALISTRKNNYSLDKINKRIGRSDLPQYAIWGDHDKVLPLSEVRDKITRIMPNLNLYIINDSGHLPHKEKFDDFNNIFFNIILSDLNNK